MKKKRLFALGGGVLLLACLCAYVCMWWFGSPLLPGSLERRYAREISAHREELLETAQACLEGGLPPGELPLPGLVSQVDVRGFSLADPDAAFVEFSCGGWGLGPSSAYYGFYYSPQGPKAFQGAEVSLVPQDGGFAWQGEGDNHGFTRGLGDGFYYFEAHF